MGRGKQSSGLQSKVQNFSVEFVSTPGDITNTCLLVSFDNERILFNCGEGTQRLCNELKCRISKVHKVLFTEVSSNTTGGLPGMLLTLTDMTIGKAENSGLEQSQDYACKLDLYGPKGLAKCVYACKWVYKRPQSEIYVHEVDNPSQKIGEKGGLVVTPIVVAPHVDLEDEPAAKRAKTSQDTFKVPAKFGKFEVSSTGTLNTPSPHFKTGSAVSYILEAPPKRGKFLAKKAAELGVKAGPDFGKLTKGLSIMTDSGRLVTSEECMEKGEPSASCAIITCPDKSFVNSLVGCECFSPYVAQEGMLFVVHLAPVEVIRDDRYQSWMKSFAGPNVKHILVNDELCSNNLPFRSSATILKALNEKIDKQLFVQDSCGRPKDYRVTLEGCVVDASLREKCNIGDMGIRYVLHPSSLRGIDRSEVLEKENGPIPPSSLDGEFDLTFLGTGSAIPSKYRNVSAILLRLAAREQGGDNHAILLDSGEGTSGQIIRKFGRELGLDIIKKQLKFVWISHMHADHHIGLLRVLYIRGRDMEPLHIMGPDDLGHFLDDSIAGDPSIQGRYVFTPIRKKIDKETFTTSDEGSPLCASLKSLGVYSLENIAVQHCYNAFALGLRLRADDGDFIVYSGDTEPCENLIACGQGAALLIHEATFEDVKVDEARQKKHSTFSEAVSVGNKMGAPYTILTHFSQRYPKVPPNLDLQASQEPDSHFKTKVIMASDLMTVGSHNLDRAVETVPAVRKVFEDFAAKND
mmetsp:Transcript_37441/g.60937  ORF Transcript_37441/g.60937 Transcript_37441/m.60937 type:complete len:747 (-) Transcript_37441:539-2779(-)|eukprot:CAMPEP_0203753260 /NCGR_PEP_ID=MMETSP0098-20131031/7049_1 /ASSEMBLY_ACC=CAM_ASM_000208 /TAXON_ID=96639 /ORGANISM=" , Strain NY0313808BC1" /LENGTH=746 /DNA_ID=CAMNT_0050643775 /DNA_START=445 /DNA_END=2685 /DNA_ORIENTATION=+